MLLAEAGEANPEIATLLAGIEVTEGDEKLDGLIVVLRLFRGNQRIDSGP